MHSPSTFAHQTRTPTLIFHGEDDHRCPIGQSEQMFVALTKAGCETEYVRYPGASHMFFARAGRSSASIGSDACWRGSRSISASHADPTMLAESGQSAGVTGGRRGS